MLTFEKQDRDVPVAHQGPPRAPGGLERTTPTRSPRRVRRCASRRSDHWEDAARAQLAGVGITFF